jgi:Tol biopolymer transport system component
MKLSPDGKSLALTVPGLKTGDSWAVMSLDGKTLRRIGNEMDAFCGGGINQWTSNGKRILAWGAHSCDDWREEPFLIDLDAGTATRVMLPTGVSEDDGVTLVPNGKEVLVSASKPSMGHLVSLDLNRVFISRAGEEN